MYPSAFAYHRPGTLAEACELLRSTTGARVLAGGHSLLPAMKLRLSAPSALVDLAGIPDLAGVRAEADALVIGAMTTHESVASHADVRARCPVLAEAAGQIGDLQVRNRGTFGGSLAHADPAADLPCVITALGATLQLAGPGGTRDIPAADFFVDLFTTALASGEILASVRVPAYGAGTGAAYVKHRHPASSFAVVGVTALVRVRDGACADARLVVGGATLKPVRAVAAEQALTGHAVDDAARFRASEKVAEAIAEPLSDSYASGEYRRHLATVLARRALASAVERAKG
jgi:carbon-monoxide dehydrogenase medium subunit